MNIDNSKSYKTEANLTTAVKRLLPKGIKYLVVCNRKGRFTAIFPMAWNKDYDWVAPATVGFMIVG